MASLLATSSQQLCRAAGTTCPPSISHLGRSLHTVLHALQHASGASAHGHALLLPSCPHMHGHGQQHTGLGHVRHMSSQPADPELAAAEPAQAGSRRSSSSNFEVGHSGSSGSSHSSPPLRPDQSKIVTTSPCSNVHDRLLMRDFIHNSLYHEVRAQGCVHAGACRGVCARTQSCRHGCTRFGHASLCACMRLLVVLA